MRISDWSSDVCSSDLAFVDLLDPLEDHLDHLRREAGRRLVEQHQPGVEHERAAHRHHLPLAARHLAGALTAPLLEPREKRVYPLLARFDLAAAEHEGPHLERSEEHTSELQSLMRLSYAVSRLQKKNTTTIHMRQ